MRFFAAVIFDCIVAVSAVRSCRFPVNIVYAFPLIKRDDVESIDDKTLQSFVKCHCIFREDLVTRVRSDLTGVMTEFLSNTIVGVASEPIKISDENINSILQRISPEYVTICFSGFHQPESAA